MKDALGNDIKIGNTYGHSVRTSGFVTVTIGRVIESNDNGVVLNVIARGRSTYDHEVKEAKIGRSIITVLSNSLFPVNDIATWIGAE